MVREAEGRPPNTARQTSCWMSAYPTASVAAASNTIGPSSFGVAGRLLRQPRCSRPWLQRPIDWIAHYQRGSHHCQPP
jgi:hypothetical protein